MAKGRMISSEIWEDDYFIDLTMLERMIWIGLITCSADDQGRLQDNVRLIRSQLFPVDDIDLVEVEAALQKFYDDKKIVRYEDEGKRIIQICNWWKYQSPRWCGKSKYNPPEGWIDRERFHGAGGGIVEKNWKLPGGFSKDSIEDSIGGSKGERTILDVNDDVKDDDDGDGDVEVVSRERDDDDNPVTREPFVSMFEDITGIPAPVGIPKIFEQWEKALGELRLSGVTEPIMRQAVEEMTAKKYKIVGPWSLRRPCEVIMAEKKREQIPKADRRRDSEGKFADFVNH